MQTINETYHTEAGLVSSGSTTDSPRSVASNVSSELFTGTVPMDSKDISVPGISPLEASLEFSAKLCTCRQDGSCCWELKSASATSLTILEDVSCTAASSTSSSACVNTSDSPLGERVPCAVAISSRTPPSSSDKFPAL